MSWIKKLFGARAPAAPTATADKRERRRNLRSEPDSSQIILVVDDSKTIRSILRKMLTDGGFSVLEAEHGGIAMDLAVQHQPKLIIMDLVMPEVDGFKATRKLRRMPETAHIPIVIMSGNQDAIENFWVTKIGAADFMSKPFNRLEVFRRIERILFENEIL
jgi:twitching motility two-component system response regulator PilH